MTVLLSLVLLALALAADAFAVALSQGAVARQRPWREALSIGAAFGAAQGVAPLIGWGLGVFFAGVIQSIDHWIAFALLVIVGGKMLWEGVHADPPGAEPTSTFTFTSTSTSTSTSSSATGWSLAALAVATSIDAAAAGFTLPAIGAPVLISAAVIAAITFATSAAGVYIGRLGARSLGWKAEVLGGLVLVGIGVKVLFDHRAFG